MCNISRKQIAIGSGVLLVLTIVGGVLAAYGEHFEGQFEGWREKHHGYDRWYAEGNDESVSRTVANTASGVVVTFTPASSSDSWAVASVSELSAEFQVMKGSAGFQNTAFKADSSTSGSVLKISIVSDLPDVVRLIQEKATSGESGLFGTELLGESFGSDQNNDRKDEYGREGKDRKERNGYLGRDDGERGE